MSIYHHSSNNTNILTRQNATRYLSANIKLPSSVEIVSAETFRRRNQIHSVHFPSTIKLIGANAFQECLSLKEVYIPENSPLPKIRSNTFSECTALSTITLPSSLKEIDGSAFYRCKTLNELHFPENLKKIGQKAFSFSGLASLELPESLEIIEEGSFFKCNFLISVCLPANVKYIGSETFRGCNRLKTLEIRQDPEYIGKDIVNRSTVIRCYKDSAVDMYCCENGVSTEYLE